MAKHQRGDSESSSEKDLSEKMSDLSDDEGPEEVTFGDSKAVALKSVKDARDSVQRYYFPGPFAHAFVAVKRRVYMCYLVSS